MTVTWPPGPDGRAGPPPRRPAWCWPVVADPDVAGEVGEMCTPGRAEASVPVFGSSVAHTPAVH